MYIITKFSALLEKNAKKIIFFDDLKKYLRIDYDDEDSLLDIFIDAATEDAEHIMRKTILHQVWRQEVELVMGDCDEDFLFEFPIVQGSKIHVPLVHKPVIDIQDVWAEQKKLDKDAYEVQIKTLVPVLKIDPMALMGLAKNKRIRLGITYKTGMYEKVDQVPQKIRLAILMLAADRYYNRDVQEDYSEECPGAKRLLAEFKDYAV